MALSPRWRSCLRRCFRPRVLLVLTVAALAIAMGVWWFSPRKGDPRLRAFVYARPPYPVVFTSRSEAASLVPCPPEGEGRVYPGEKCWQATEGRLRLLTPDGEVHELTWNKHLPDGSTLVDVMSPSISFDGSRVVFAGRKGGDDAGRFRLYEVGIDGKGLKALTGEDDDPGCLADPPMRYAADADALFAEKLLACSAVPAAVGSIPLGVVLAATPETLKHDARRRTDYDDIDPAYLPDGQIVFVSSRIPDLGRDHARRSTTLWIMDGEGKKRPLTANRNNDRWPAFLSTRNIAFSLWSRNREVISADGYDIQPVSSLAGSSTQPTNAWFGATIEPDGDHFSMLLKPRLPVWRVRPLFNANLTFMTSRGASPWDDVRLAEGLTVVQSPANVMELAESSLASSVLPLQEKMPYVFGPAKDEQGRRLALATPSPCPDDCVLLAGAAWTPEREGWDARRYGIYLAKQDWSSAGPGAHVDAEACALQLLFDDPDCVDSEPVAVYARPASGSWRLPMAAPTEMDRWPVPRYEHPLIGKPGKVDNLALFIYRDHSPLIGHKTDIGEIGIFDAPPSGTIDHVRIYLSHRDRFDHAVWPRLNGPWEELQRVPLKAGGSSLHAWIPSGVPSVLAGFGKDGKVASWETKAVDSRGTKARFYAFAGDHYSATRPLGYGFCLGCHPGHTALGQTPEHPEKRR